MLNDDERPSSWTFKQVDHLENEAGTIGTILKSQASILHGWIDTKHGALSGEDIAGLGSLLEEFGKRLCVAAGWDSESEQK